MRDFGLRFNHHLTRAFHRLVGNWAFWLKISNGKLLNLYCKSDRSKYFFYKSFVKACVPNESLMIIIEKIVKSSKTLLKYFLACLEMKYVDCTFNFAYYTNYSRL